MKSRKAPSYCSYGNHKWSSTKTNRVKNNGRQGTNKRNNITVRCSQSCKNESTGYKYDNSGTKVGTGLTSLGRVRYCLKTELDQKRRG